MSVKFIIVDGESISISVYEGEVEKYNLDKSFGLII